MITRVGWLVRLFVTLVVISRKEQIYSGYKFSRDGVERRSAGPTCVWRNSTTLTYRSTTQSCLSIHHLAMPFRLGGPHCIFGQLTFVKS